MNDLRKFKTIWEIAWILSYSDFKIISIRKFRVVLQQIMKNFFKFAKFTVIVMMINIKIH